MDLIVQHAGREAQMKVTRDGDRYQVTLGDRTYEVDASAARATLRSLRIDGSHHEVAVRPEGRDGLYTVSTPTGTAAVSGTDPLTHLASQTRGKSAHRRTRITAYMPGRVVAILAKEGDDAAAGQGIVVLEAMKMENEIKAEHDGTITRIHVEPGQAVERGDPLFELD